MKKINLSFKNSKLDFFLKSFLSTLFFPIIGMRIVAILFYMLGKDYWEYRGEGSYAYAFIGVYVVFISYFFFLIITWILILTLNKKLMSGDKLNAKTKLGLFLLSIVFYITTLFVLYFINTLL